MAVRIETNIFELCNGRYRSLSELAKVMRIPVSQVYRVHQGKRHINEKFIIGAIKAFPQTYQLHMELSWYRAPLLYSLRCSEFR
ncbi:unnamed protein product [marine sediment metagenome]|uniref:Uncharacterized protein n=1 Tax=marine sediment metagenome TaxID=412755 RepID=X1J9S2_9ZZZZ